MEINQNAEYSVSRDGKVDGPIPGANLADFVRKKQLLPTDSLWTDGMDEWLPAGNFEDLAQIFAPAPKPQAVEEPAETKSASVTQLLGKNPIADQMEHTEFGAEPMVVRKRAKFGPLVVFLIVALIGMGVFLGIGGLAVLQTDIDPSTGEIESTAGAEQMLNESPYLVPATIAAIVLYIVGLIGYGILSLVYLHRAWAYVQDVPNPTTTPGKAVGFFFIPLFAPIWQFFAYHRWAGDYNLRCDYADPVNAKRVSEGLPLAHCILSLLALPFLHIFVMHQMCKGINHLADSPPLELDENAGYHL